MDRRMMMQQSAAELVTDGLLHYWDAVNNSGNGHDDTITSWKDLIGSADLVMNDSTVVTWLEKGLSMPGTSGKQRLLSQSDASLPIGKSIEVFFSTDTVQVSTLFNAFYDVDHATQAYGKVTVYADNTFSVRGAGSKSYLNPHNITDFHSISASFDTNISINAIYINAVPAEVGPTTHTMQGSINFMSAGASPTTWGYPFNGVLHAMRIYDKILTPDEVLQNYQYDVSRYL